MKSRTYEPDSSKALEKVAGRVETRGVWNPAVLTVWRRNPLKSGR